MELVAIIGAGGHAREVLEIFEAINALGARYEVVGWLVEPRYGAAGAAVHGRPILGDLDWLREHGNGVRVICAVGDPAVRRRLVTRAAAWAPRFCNAVHPQAVCGPRVVLGTGVVVAAGSVLSGDIRLGDHVLVNSGSTIAHDAVLDEFATLSPGCHVAGNGAIGAGALLGTGANVVPRVQIGAWSRIGAGCAVIADVPADSTVVGVPGRVVRQRAPGWHLRD